MLRLERIAILSIWVLNPNFPSLIEGLSQKGFTTAKVKPGYDTYDISFLEPPNVIAVKGPIRIYYDLGRRNFTVEGSKPEEVIAAFKELELVLEDRGMNPSRGVLTYDLQVRAKVGDLKLPLKELDTEDILGFNTLNLFSTLVMKEGDPNTARWFDLRLAPVWPTWGDEEKRIFDLVLIYRDGKERVLQFVHNIEEMLNKLLRMIAEEE